MSLDEHPQMFAFWKRYLVIHKCLLFYKPVVNFLISQALRELEINISCELFFTFYTASFWGHFNVGHFVFCVISIIYDSVSFNSHALLWSLSYIVLRCIRVPCLCPYSHIFGLFFILLIITFYLCHWIIKMENRLPQGKALLI